jgi:hypothetical protein
MPPSGKCDAIQKNTSFYLAVGIFFVEGDFLSPMGLNVPRVRGVTSPGREFSRDWMAEISVQGAGSPHIGGSLI